MEANVGGKLTATLGTAEVFRMPCLVHRRHTFLSTRNHASHHDTVISLLTAINANIQETQN